MAKCSFQKNHDTWAHDNTFKIVREFFKKYVGSNWVCLRVRRTITATSFLGQQDIAPFTRSFTSSEVQTTISLRHSIRRLHFKISQGLTWSARDGVTRHMILYFVSCIDLYTFFNPVRFDNVVRVPIFIHR